MTADYEAKLAEFAQAEELSPERLEILFREHCTTFREETMDKTPNGVIRRLTMAKLRWHLSEDA